MNSGYFRGYTIFCDDIRDESGGKTSLIGVYRGTMFVNGDFPFLLPKFGMAITYFERRGHYSEEEVTLRIFLPGDDDDSPSIQGIVPMREARSKVASDQIEKEYVVVGSHIVLSPLVIGGSGLIKVRVQCGTEVFKLGALVVTKMPSDKSES